MKEKLGQEAMFCYSYRLDNGVTVQSIGASKRFYAACAAMQGLLANHNLQWRDRETDGITKELIPENVASVAYRFADELLKQENE